MARAKNTSRAVARKRTRDSQRAELLADENEQIDEEASVASAPAARPSMFQLPDFREDIRALPTVFRTRRLVWLPFGLVLIGFILRLLIFGMPVELQTWVVLYLQFFFVPEGLFAYFIAGFLAPRASYLVGGLLGVLSGALYGISLLATMPVGADPSFTSAVQAEAVRGALSGPVLGVFAGGFAAWYRNFLRQMQDNGRRRRADKEAQERAKRRAERQESRRVVKQRPTS